MNILTNHRPTEELQKIDSAHHLHPFTAQMDLKQKGARIITSGKGVFVTDSDGTQLLDAMAGLWCVNIGYGRDELAEVAARQMKELPYYNTFFQTSHIPAIELAEKISKLTPKKLNNVFFGSSGSEANDSNIRIVREYWAALGKPEKKIIISRKNAYHGSTMGGASLSGMTTMHRQGGLPIPDIHHIDEPNWWSHGGDSSPIEFGKATALQLEASINHYSEDRIAAFIAEPVQGAGGVIVPPDSYWPEIKKICNKYEILLIADEVICGFGRTGSWFGSQAMGIHPDVMTIAKGLSSGYQPIAGSIVSDEIAEVIGKEEFNHGYTYSSHPVAAAVACENIRILKEEKIIENIAGITGPYLKKKWGGLKEHPLVGEVNLIGMMGSLVLSPNKSTRAKFATKDGTAGIICRQNCLNEKLIMRAVGDRMIISPPLIINRDEIDLLIERVKKALDKTLDELKTMNLFE